MEFRHKIVIYHSLKGTTKVNKLEQLVLSLPLIQSIFPEDAKLVVFDTERVIADLPGKIINLSAKVGVPWSEFKGTVSYKAFVEKKAIREERGPEVFGIAYIAISVPIFDGTELIGVLSALISNNKLNTMKIGSEKLTKAVASLSTTSTGLNEAAGELASQVQQLFIQSESIIQAVANSKSTLAKVQEISEHSKLVGLNAAIEAAHLGEFGRGFGVISKEIRNMADFSKDLSVDIQEKMKQIERSIVEMHRSIQQIAAFTQEQSAGLSQMNSAFEQILLTSDELLASSRL